MIKVFNSWIKVFLAFRIKNLLLKELSFLKLDFFIKSEFLDLTKFDFLALVKFIIVDRFLISLSINSSSSITLIPLTSIVSVILLPTTSPERLLTFRILSSSVIFYNEMSGIRILLIFLMKLL